MLAKPDLSQVYPVQFSPESGCNVTDDAILDQVRTNIARGLPQAYPHPINPAHAILVCGGPSLQDSEYDLVRSAWSGGKVVTVNGTYNWCLDRNIRPSATIMLDARDFCKRFVEREVPECRYLLSSQCHPSVFDLCRQRDVWIWHTCSAGEAELSLLNDYYFKRTYPVTLGTTVAVRAISLLRMLGFYRIEVFGLDSCWLGDAHHAYPQQENDADERVKVWLRLQDDKGDYADQWAQEFECSPWHVKQAQDFQGLVKERGESFQLKVHGPGLIAAMINTGAKLATE